MSWITLSRVNGGSTTATSDVACGIEDMQIINDCKPLTALDLIQAEVKVTNAGGTGLMKPIIGEIWIEIQIKLQLKNMPLILY